MVIELYDPKVLFIITGVIVFVIVSYRAYRRLNIKCPHCAVKMKLVSVINSAGVEVNTRITASVDLGPRRYTQNWLCDDCGHKKKIKVWG